MNKLVFLFLLCSILVFSQKDKENQNVELPDFVITGTEKVSVDKVKKAEPDLISVTSEEFIKPSYSPEELELKKFSNPIKKDINYYDSVHYQKGYLDLAAGNNKLASGKFNYSSPFNGGIFNGQIGGFYGRPFIPNADKVILNGSAELDLYSNSNSVFLPGSEYIFKGGYGFSNYKLFASAAPETQRTVHDLNGGVGYRNFQSDHFQMDLQSGAHFISLNKESFTDKMFFISGYANLQTQNFLLSIESAFKTISIGNNYTSGTGSSFFSVLPKIGLRVSDIFKADLGIYFSRGAGVTFSNPYLSVTLKMDKSMSLFAEYNPHVEYVNAGEFLKINPYLDLRNHYNQYITYAGCLSMGIKYEYEKYFQINAGLNYKGSDNYRYFTPSLLKGYFALATADAKILGGYVDLLYHLGPMGFLYGRVDVKSAADTVKRTIPYIPGLSSKITYGYTIKQIKLDTEISILYNSSVYTDIKNLNKLPSYVDFGIKFTYLLKSRFNLTLEFSNLLNKTNYIWEGYKEMPINVSAGIRYLL